jgi:hypothetical protein
MTNNILSFNHGDKPDSLSVLEADKVSVPKYLAVLWAAIDTLEGKAPSKFDPVKVPYEAQNFVLSASLMARSLPENHKKYYEPGTMSDEIFK